MIDNRAVKMNLISGAYRNYPVTKDKKDMVEYIYLSSEADNGKAEREGKADGHSSP